MFFSDLHFQMGWKLAEYEAAWSWLGKLWELRKYTSFRFTFSSSSKHSNDDCKNRETQLHFRDSVWLAGSRRKAWQMGTLCIRNGISDQICPNSTRTMSPSFPCYCTMFGNATFSIRNRNHQIKFVYEFILCHCIIVQLLQVVSVFFSIIWTYMITHSAMICCYMHG